MKEFKKGKKNPKTSGKFNTIQRKLVKFRHQGEKKIDAKVNGR